MEGDDFSGYCVDVGQVLVAGAVYLAMARLRAGSAFALHVCIGVVGVRPAGEACEDLLAQSFVASCRLLQLHDTQGQTQPRSASLCCLRTCCDWAYTHTRTHCERRLTVAYCQRSESSDKTGC